MRALRSSAGQSLRQVERASGWGRGTLSQLENGKARPNRAVIEWYDRNLGGDGLLVSMFTEARVAHATRRDRKPGPSVVEGDAFEIVGSTLASGERVEAGSTLRAGWKVRNAGSVTWRGRAVARVGAPSALRLISSAAAEPIPDCTPEETVDVSVDIGVPDVSGTLAAYWHIVDSEGHPCFEPPSLLSMIVVVP